MWKNDFTKIPNGAAGIEEPAWLLWTYGVLENRIDVHKFVDLFATQPAKIFGSVPAEGLDRTPAATPTSWCSIRRRA
jgi:dihydropyrimidinase